MSLTYLIAAARSQDMAWRVDQERITAEVIRPAMPRATRLLATLRRQVDQEAATLARQQPAGDITRYPVGFCAVIRDRVVAGMLRDPEIRRIVDEGGRLTPVFVILKDRYFQNAIQFGNLYIDVANDSVDPAKPWLEWMDVHEVPFENVGDLSTLARVAEGYHRCRVFPNVCFPLIAPVVPLLGIDEAGCVQLLHFQPGGFLKDLADGFPRLRHWLQGPASTMPALPEEHAAAVEAACAGNDFAEFPFEFRRGTLADIAAHADAYQAAFADPARHQEILRVLDLVRHATVRLHAMQVSASSPATPRGGRPA